MKYVVVKGKLTPWHEFSRMRREIGRLVESELSSPSIIRDGLDGVQNPVDGKLYDSKSKYYQTVKAAGCEIVGNEAEKMIGLPAARSNVGREEIAAAVNKVKQGYAPKLGENADG